MGTVLNTFTCTDPDSPGSTLDYQLLFHSPASASSLCLRDRVLEVPRPRPQTHGVGCLDRKGVAQWSRGSRDHEGEGYGVAANLLYRRVRVGYVRTTWPEAAQWA